MTRGVFEDLTGKQFGLWQVVRLAPNTKPIRWECFCQCGTKRPVTGSSLRNGTSKSCGCASPRGTTHGLRKHPTYTVWDKMIDRCCRSNSKHFKYYGGRGIRICKEWRKNFKAFYDWAIANGWKSGLTIDRIYNDKHYEPLNCQFITQRENNCKKRKQSKSGYHNIYKEDGRFRVRFQINGANRGFGSFKTLEEAIKVRDNVVEEIL